MKKIISIVLLLAMVLGVFAGCDNQPTEPAADPLDSAVAYLKNMYDKSTKYEDNKLTADKELLPAVTIEGVSYPVTWSINVTAGPADCIVIADGATAGTQKVDIVTQPEEEVRFTLTGTITDANGVSKTIDIKFYSPAVQKVEVSGGEKIVIYMVSDAKYMTGIDYLYTSSSGSQKHELELTDNKAEALPLTLQTNADGTVSFVTDGGLFLFCDATNVQFVAEEGDFTKFILEAAEGGQYIKCAVANYSGKPQYLEVYSGYMTCYGMSETSNLALYIFELQDAEGASGTVGESAPTEPTQPTEPTENNDPAADTDLSIVDALALGASKAHNTYTAGKYYVSGVITEVYNTTYGNMKITDEAGNILTIYGTFDATGENRYDAMATMPVAGDTVTIYGIIGQYNDVPQMKNGWIVAHTPAVVDPTEPTDPTDPTEPTEPTDPTEPTEPAVKKVVIVNAGKYVTGTDYLYKSSSGSEKHELVISDDIANALQLVVRDNGDGTVTFVTDDGKFLMADGTNVQIVSAESENTKFVLEQAPEGFYIRCATATYFDKPQYLEIYSGYLTVYGFQDSKADIYTFQLVEVE